MEEFRDLVVAYRLPRILLTALELRLFTVMGKDAWLVPDLARRLRVSLRGLDILCRNLAAAGILNKLGRRYRNGTLAGSVLNAGHPAYRGAYLELLQRGWEDWSQLTRSVKRGRPVERNRRETQASRRQFTWAMHHRSLDVASQVAAQVDLRGARTLLDLGGGPGTFALAFLKRHPRLRATVCDRPAALQVAREIARPLPHGARLGYLPLDFIKKPIPGRYDVIWYSNVLHIYSPATNRGVFRNMAAALSPSGRVYIQDAFTFDRKGLVPAETTLFAATMLLFTEEGDTYALREVTRWLREAGFGRVRRVRLKEGAGDWEGGLLEASRPAPSRSQAT
jgi:SAM-dependent methyltransferase